MDEIFIEGLELRSVIGVHAWERAFAQRLLLDVRLASDITVAGASDALVDALDYAALSEQLQARAASESCALIEALAERLAQEILADTRVHRVELTLRKPGALPRAQGVGVRIVRHSPQSS